MGEMTAKQRESMWITCWTKSRNQLKKASNFYKEKTNTISAENLAPLKLIQRGYKFRILVIGMGKGRKFYKNHTSYKEKQ